MKKITTLLILIVFSAGQVCAAVPYSTQTSRETYATKIDPKKVTKRAEHYLERSVAFNGTASVFTGGQDFMAPEVSDGLERILSWDRSLDGDNPLKSDDEAYERMKKMRKEAFKYFLQVLDVREGESPNKRERMLFEICLAYINVVFKEYGNQDDETITKKIREQVLDRARDQIEYFERNFHEFKNIFRIADIERDAVIRYTIDNEFVTVSLKKWKAGLPVDSPEQYAFVGEIMERLRTPEGRAMVGRVFDKDLAHRHVTNGMSLNEYKSQLIDKLLGQTQIYLVKNGCYLVPGLPDILVHTRRNVRRRVTADQRAPYALWFGELFLKKVYEEHGLDMVARLMLEGAIRFDKTDDQVFAMTRDQAFWAGMAKIAQAIERMEPRRPPNETYFRIERVYRKMLQLTDDPFDKDAVHFTGMDPLHLHFLYRCYDELEALFEQYPAAADDETMDDTMVALSWPIIMKHADELIKIDVFNKADIKDIFRVYAVYREHVTRNTPEGTVLIPQHGKPSREKLTPQEEREAQPILDLTMKARDPKVLKDIFDEYMWWRYARVGVEKQEREEFRDRHIGYIRNETHVDTVRDVNILIPHTFTSAHARSGWTQRFDYEGKLYGVWVSEPRMRVLSLAENGYKILAWILLEEAPHFSPDGILYKPHPENDVFEKYQDYLDSVEHGDIWFCMMAFLNRVVRAGQSVYPDFNASLREHSITRTNKPEMKVLEDGVKYFLDTDMRVYLEDPVIPFQQKIEKVQTDVLAILEKYGDVEDAQLFKLAEEISDSILDYAENYEKGRINDVIFEKGYEIAYLKSA